jgi:hypothetical protein
MWCLLGSDSFISPRVLRYPKSPCAPRSMAEIHPPLIDGGSLSLAMHMSKVKIWCSTLLGVHGLTTQISRSTFLLKSHGLATWLRPSGLSAPPYSKSYGVRESRGLATWLRPSGLSAPPYSKSSEVTESRTFEVPKSLHVALTLGPFYDTTPQVFRSPKFLDSQSPILHQSRGPTDTSQGLTRGEDQG